MDKKSIAIECDGLDEAELASLLDCLNVDRGIRAHHVPPYRAPQGHVIFELPLTHILAAAGGALATASLDIIKNMVKKRIEDWLVVRKNQGATEVVVLYGPDDKPEVTVIKTKR